MSELTEILVGVSPVLAVLLWCNFRDRCRGLADGVRARANAAANRILGGESLVSVRVEPAIGWRVGRVHLSAPGGYETVVGLVSNEVIQDLPDNYELVVRGASAAAGR